MQIQLTSVYENGKPAGFNVVVDGRVGEQLNPDEVLGVVAHALYSDYRQTGRPHQFLRSHDQHQAERSKRREGRVPDGDAPDF